MIFDEKHYLEAYPDVRRAIESGSYGTAYAHYVAFGAVENRSTYKETPLVQDEVPSIVVYTTTKNEEVILPFFLAHYGAFAKKIIVYDNNSTDRTREICLSHPKVELRCFDTHGWTDDSLLVTIKNTCYQEQVGHADYVIVCDTDEFLHAPSLAAILALFKKHGITIANTAGYEMVSDVLPTPGIPITSQLRFGVPKSDFSKSILFSPEIEINFAPGSHCCHPKGKIVVSDIRLAVLHYKYISLEHVIKKTVQLRLSEANQANGWGTHLNTDFVTEKFNELMKKRDVILTQNGVNWEKVH